MKYRQPSGMDAAALFFFNSHRVSKITIHRTRPQLDVAKCRTKRNDKEDVAAVLTVPDNVIEFRQLNSVSKYGKH